MTALPDILRKDGLFCCWRYEERNGRKTKVPYQPVTGLGVKSNDPNSFVSYDAAVQAKGYDGIGLGIFNGICAIDLDNCVTDSGYYTGVTAEIVTLTAPVGTDYTFCSGQTASSMIPNDFIS